MEWVKIHVRKIWVLVTMENMPNCKACATVGNLKSTELNEGRTWQIIAHQVHFPGGNWYKTDSIRKDINKLFLESSLWPSTSYVKLNAQFELCMYLL